MVMVCCAENVMAQFHELMAQLECVRAMFRKVICSSASMFEFITVY